MISFMIDAREIYDWNSFHDYFQSVCNFPDYYGRNMDAWIDCVTDLIEINGQVIFSIENMKNLKEKLPEFYFAILDGSSFVNYRFIKEGCVDFYLVISYSN